MMVAFYRWPTDPNSTYRSSVSGGLYTLASTFKTLPWLPHTQNTHKPTRTLSRGTRVVVVVVRLTEPRVAFTLLSAIDLFALSSMAYIFFFGDTLFGSSNLFFLRLLFIFFITRQRHQTNRIRHFSLVSLFMTEMLIHWFRKRPLPELAIVTSKLGQAKTADSRIDEKTTNDDQRLNSVGYRNWITTIFTRHEICCSTPIKFIKKIH